MAYQALYRKWRPRTFDDVVGQSSITDTLKNAIKRNKISHAFLFAGPRGTGKTSCAKIFAKALNCTNLQDGEPCNECENCLAADKGSMSDIIEIDAASNNGVDEIRDIRDKVKYAPTQGKYKVYIIDEVHMLSMGAFNALLKTLEEPPEHVVFILATTELQKVPATIISRTQRYNFKRIEQVELVARMQYILQQEDVEYEPRSLEVIAQIADGGMRDSLSILDQILSYDQDKVKYKDALKITGYADQAKIETLLYYLLTYKTQDALDLVKELINTGSSTQNILDEIIQLTVNVMLAVKGNQSQHFLTDNYLEQLKEITEDRFSIIVQQANDALNDLRYTNQQQIPLLVFIVNVTQKQVSIKNNNDSDIPVEHVKRELTSDTELSQLKREINLLKAQIADLKKKPVASNWASSRESKSTPTQTKDSAATLEKVTTSKEARNVKAKTVHTNNRDQVYHVLENATKEDISTIKDIWPDLLSMLKVSQRAVLEVLEPVAASSDQVVLKCKYELWFEKATEDTDLLEQIENNIARLSKHNYDIVLIADSAWVQVRNDFVASHKEELLAKKLKKIEEKEQEKNNSNETQVTAEQQKEVVDKAKELFGDLAQIKD